MVYLNDQIDRIDLTETLRRVSRQRAEYALRYRQKHDQQLSLAVYLLLMEGLEKEYGITEQQEFVFGLNGKPALKAHPEIHFNLSHCRRAALCVTSDQPVGCDIETVPEELDMGVCRYCFNEEEIACILGSDRPTLAFTRLWTCKEALLKLTGEGLTDSLPCLLRSPLAETVSFQTHIAPDSSYVYTVCSQLL